MIFRFLLLAVFSYLPLSQVQAEHSDDSNVLPDKIIQSYGGASLEKLERLWFRDQYIRIDEEQSFYPGVEEAKFNDAELLVDFSTQLKELRFRGEHDQKAYYQHHVLNESGAYYIDHAAQQITKAESERFSSIGGSVPYRLDLYIAKLVSLHRSSLERLPDGDYYGRSVFKARLAVSGYAPMILSIAPDGRILSALLEGRKQHYHFSHHRYVDISSVGQVLFASNAHIEFGGKVRNVSTRRELLDAAEANAPFTVNDSYQPAKSAERLIPESMVVNSLSEGVYHVGKGFGYSMFIDVGEYFYGVGGYQGLSERYAALQKTLKSQKPLKYHIVTHHHRDHLAGMQEAADLGATFIGTPKALLVVKSLLASELAENRFMSFEGQLKLEGERLLLAEFSNTHVANHVLTLLPAKGVLFSEDLYFSLEKSTIPKGESRHKDLSYWLAKQRFNIKSFAAGHSVRVLSNLEFSKSLQNREVRTTCPQTWYICQ